MSVCILQTVESDFALRDPASRNNNMENTFLKTSDLKSRKIRNLDLIQFNSLIFLEKIKFLPLKRLLKVNDTKFLKANLL